MANEHTEVATTVPGAQPAESAFPPFDLANVAPLLIWLALTFGLLYLLMSKVALPRLHDILQTRMGKISGDLKEANRLRSEANLASAAHDKTLAEAKAKAQALAQETHMRLAAEADGKRQTLEADLNAKLVKAEAQIAEMKTKAMSNVHEIARDAAAAIVQQVTGKPADPNAIAAAVAATEI